MVEKVRETYPQANEFEVITDLHLHLDTATGQVSMADDGESVIATTIIDEWAEGNDAPGIEQIVKQMSRMLQTMAEEQFFDDCSLAKPFSFVLEDDDHETIDELYIANDDTIYISNELLAGMDEELDDFLAKLMEN